MEEQKVVQGNWKRLREEEGGRIEAKEAGRGQITDYVDI